MEIVWQTPANTPQSGDYILRDGRRYVRPYYFEFISHVKNRWAGKTIVDLFAEEFKGRPYDYYVGAIKSGRIQVDGQMVHASYVVQSSQKISHFLHRHEPPTLAVSISVLQTDPDIITVCKPASVPVHPCGQYRKNTVVGILQAEHGLAPVFPVHRLDRLVSGLLIFARNADKAEQFRQQQCLNLNCGIPCFNLHLKDYRPSFYLLNEIEAGLLQKEYIAKVVGVFPEEEQIVNANVDYDAREGRSSTEVIDKCTGRASKGKVACTRFIRISTDGILSVVLCKPVTGRTHQIRVHLQHLGYPIANDMLYLSNDVVLRSTRGKGADKTASSSIHQPFSDCDSHDAKADDMHLGEEFTVDPMCTNCPNLAPNGYDGDEEGLWLHCLRYSGPGWSYECPYPDWATLNCSSQEKKIKLAT